MKKRKPVDASSPFNFRPRESVADRLLKLCEELGYERPQALNYFAEAILDMIEAETPRVPSLVTLVRVARNEKSTLLTGERDFEGLGQTIERRDIKEAADYPMHPKTDYYGEIMAGPTNGVAAEAAPSKIDVPAGVAQVADFAVHVSGDSMEPLINDGDVAVFRRAEVAGNGQIVAAVVEGQMLLKKFMRKNGGPARLESLNQKYAPIPLNEDVRIQGIYEGKFDPAHLPRAKKSTK